MTTPAKTTDKPTAAETISHDRMTDLKAAQGSLAPTAIDAQGLERIVGPAVDDNWRPAPTEPHPDDIAHGEQVLAWEKARREERLGATQAARENVAAGSDVTKAALEAERK